MRAACVTASTIGVTRMDELLTSKIMDMVGLIWMISELGKHNFLLSSRTVFMFSIQMASTGPSSTSHFRSVLGSEARFLKGKAYKTEGV